MCYRNDMQMVLFLLFVATVSACRSQTGKRSSRCILPPYPSNGRYEVAGDPAAKPGDELEYVYLNVSCNHGLGVIGNNVMLCIQGEWSTTMPQCVSVCHLQEQPSVMYACKRLGVQGFAPCGEYEPVGTSVQTTCRSGFYSRAAMPRMRCVDGTWSNVAAQCSPECGILPDNATSLPWFVYIYKNMDNKKSKYEYKYVCVGNIISQNLVISVAHCFSNKYESISPTDYVVVTGDTYLGAHVTNDTEMFHVQDVKIGERFSEETNYQDDIALVILRENLTYSKNLQRVCLDFDYSFNKRQLREGNLGTVAVLPDPLGNQSPQQIQWIPYIPVSKCIRKASSYFREYITADKICAGRDNGTFICKGNSGSGLVFPEDERGITRYYLRGLVSTAPVRLAENCKPTDFVAFTDINQHQYFIKENLAPLYS